MSVHAPTKPVAYRMPRPPEGGIVRWAAQPQGPWYPAAVVDAGDQAIQVAAFVPGNRGLHVRDGVRHATDPAFHKQEDQEGGIWDHDHDHLLLLTLVSTIDGQGDRIATLSQDVERLESEIVALRKSLGA